jgi:hypothetical protein
MRYSCLLLGVTNAAIWADSLLYQFNNLKSRTGVETLLFTTRGSTNMPLQGISFSTSGVENFLEGALKTDTQDFLGRMEGFAIQGVKGIN